MTRMTPLLERNEQFASTYTPVALGQPTAQMLIVTCLDQRVDPAIVLGLRLGEAPVIRNAGGRVTQAVIDDLAHLAFLAGQLFGGQDADDRLFEVAVVHHTQCGTSLLADPSFRHQAAEATGLPEAAGCLRRRRPAHHRQGRRRAAAHLTAALTEGECLRPRVRHRHRAPQYHRGRPVLIAAKPALPRPGAGLRCVLSDRRGHGRSGHPLDTVARQSGLGAPETLHRVFRRHWRISPGDYRRWLQSKES